MTAQALPEIANVDRRTFDNEIRPAGRPVVLRQVGRDWPAVQAAQRSAEEGVAYLQRFSHGEPVAAILGEPSIGGRFFYNDDLTGMNFVRGQTPLDPFLARLLRDRDRREPFAMAVQSVPLPTLLPGFAEANATDLVAPDVVPRIWLGNAIRVATHYDLMENIGVVAMGRRRFTLFPPDQVANLYMGPLELTPAGTPVSLVDPENPDLVRYPRFAAALAHAQVAELGPGDAIFVPAIWWHHVAALDPLNVLVNYWWGDAQAASPFGALVHALMAVRDLPPAQRHAWRGWFDHYVFADGADEVGDHLPVAARGILAAASPARTERLRDFLVRLLGGKR
jgi:hypothetical protein